MIEEAGGEPGEPAERSEPSGPLVDDAGLDRLERYCKRPAYPLMSIRVEEVAALVAEIRRLRRRVADLEGAP